ncbi:MAG: efflux RND transporter permease subunit [Verrucomicrobiae bacterium]|nr:efflux RND transporter permease subunit [Verrucomicrobiae bacterium]
MALSDISIKRPIFASMMSAAIVLFGLITLTRLPLREYPDIDPPVVSVTTVLLGANPEVIETEVTEILEEELNTIDGIKSMTSSSREQVSAITVEFELNRNVDASAQDVRDKVSRVRGKLPDDIDEPVISKLSADAQAIMWLALSSDVYSPIELTRFAEDVMKDRLQTINGVGSIIVGGAKRFAVRIWLDADKLAAHRLTVADVQRTLRAENVDLPSGRIEGSQREFTVKTEGELKRPEDFNDLVVTYEGGTPIRIRDIGRAEAGVENERNLARFCGKLAVGLGIVKQSKANTVAVARRIKERVEQLKPTLPAGISVRVAYDSSIFIERSVTEVAEALLIAFGLVVFVIFVFLRSIRTTLIPVLAIPTSIIGTFALMYLLGFTINNLTLLALTLAIGVVVDDAIVVLENAFRHMEQYKKTALQAATEATHEIQFAVIATTISLIAVFVPLAFMQGSTARLFNEFALAVVASIALSAFVALSLTPMLCSRILVIREKHNAMYNAFERFFNSLSDTYRRWLNWAVHHRKTVLLIGAASVSLIVLFFYLLKTEFIPTDDKGSFLVIIAAPEGSTMDYTDKSLRKIEELVAAIPERDTYFAAIGLAMQGPGRVNDGIMFCRLKPWDQRKRSLQDIVAELQPKLFSIPGVLAFPIIPPPLGFSFSRKFQFVVQNQDLKQLDGINRDFLNKVRGIPGLVFPDTDFKLNKPELHIDIDRHKAADLGVSVRDVASSLQILLGGLDLSKFTLDNKQYDVIAQLEHRDRVTPQDLEKIYVRTRSGSLIPLSNIASMREVVSPSQINHYERVRSTIISAGLNDSMSLTDRIKIWFAVKMGKLSPQMVPQTTTLGEAIDRVEKLARTSLPAGFTYAFAGESREFKESESATKYAFILALIVVYMVLASQFESLIHPFTVMLAVPLAIVGGLGALLVFGMTLNLFSKIGLIMLIGLVTKNSILLVDFANKAKEAGKSTLDAVVEAGAIRLRPILMTSISTIFGVLPIAFGLGAGSMSRRPLGMAVVGGIVTSTFLTLFIVPVVYSLFDELRVKIASRKSATVPGSAGSVPAGSALPK